MLAKLEYFLEIAGQLLPLHIKGAETLDTWRIYQVTTPWHFQHLTECSGVGTCVVRFANGGCLQVGTRYQAVDERALPHSTIAAQQIDLSPGHREQFFNAHARSGGKLQALVAHLPIERQHHLLVAFLLRSKDVGLVECQHHGHTISLGASQKAVYESGGSLRIVDGDYQNGLVNVSRKDMALLGKVRRLAYDIIASILYLADKGRSLLVGNQLHPVTHSHRIGAADALQAEVTFYLALYQLALVGLDGIPTARILDD